MKRNLIVLCAALPLFAFSSACKPEASAGPGAEAGGAPGEGASGEQQEPGAPGVAWADKNFQQRKETMGLVVFPSMIAAFKEHDAERFADFKCQTCHGDDGKDVEYKMPNDLTPLSKDDPIADGNDIDPEMTKFMLESVVPAMNEHLAGTEVNCHSCHLEG